MSTRCMVLVAETYDDGSKFIPLYRHSDGYPLGAGSTILEALDKAPVDAESLLAILLAERYTFESGLVGRDGGPVHRAATWQPEEQGDLEYVYVIKPAARGPSIGARSGVAAWTVTIHERGSFANQVEDWRKWGNLTYTREQLEDRLKIEQAAYDARLAARQRSA